MSFHNEELSKTLYQPNINIFNNENDLVKTMKILKSFHEVEEPEDQNNSRKIKNNTFQSRKATNIDSCIAGRRQ